MDSVTSRCLSVFGEKYLLLKFVMGASSKYEEFQEMLEQQKTMYLQQNNQLARYNSSLMMKITDLETKISELVQENVKLRSRLSMGELKYRERMNRTVETVERGVMDRLDEISRLFVDLRRQESIAADGMERACLLYTSRCV